MSAAGAAPGLEAPTCERCQRAAATAAVEFAQNIGLVVLRWPSEVRAALCRDCAARVFWRTTLVTAVFGWWGVVSFFASWAILVRNVRAFRRTRALPPPR